MHVVLLTVINCYIMATLFNARHSRLIRSQFTMQLNIVVT